MRCNPPTPVQDGFIKVANYRGSYRLGSLAIYHCNQGFLLWGTSTRTCTERGEWSGGVPSCRKISCGEPPTIAHTAMEYLTRDSVVTYSCIPGYSSYNGKSRI